MSESRRQSEFGPLSKTAVGNRPIVVEGLMVRSKVDTRGDENAWVSLLVSSPKADSVLVTEFKFSEYGEEAWGQAVKYAKRLADRLGTTNIRKRRGGD